MRLYIAGRRGAGKTTAAAILKRDFGARVVRITEPLYEVARRYFGMEGKDRILLQRLGDAFREIDPAWLARYAANRLEREADGNRELLVIEGVRTQAEAGWLNAQGWVGILITAPEDVRLARRAGEPAEADLHHTETEVDSLPVAVRVENSGTVDGFAQAIRAVIQVLATAAPAGGAVGG